MNIRSFTATTLVLTIIGLGACSPRPEIISDHRVECSEHYFSKEKNVVLRVAYTGINLESTRDSTMFYDIMEKNAKNIGSHGYKRFAPQGRLGIGPLSGKPHLICMITFKYDGERQELESVDCSPAKTQEGLAAALDAL